MKTGDEFIRSRMPKRPVIAVEFELADGSLLQRRWNFQDPDFSRAHHWLKDGPPDWLCRPDRRWPDPQGPITFTGLVVEGREQEALEAVHGS